MAIRSRCHTRRGFLKRAGAAGAGALAASFGSWAAASDHGQRLAAAMVPTRPFGKTGVDVPILALGGVLGTSDLIVFRQAFALGVRYWDTADSYRWGRNEAAIGKYFSRFPEHRKQIFLVTKSGSTDPDGLDKDLAQSLARMNTDYVDLYFIHAVANAEKELTPAVKAWADRAKRSGKIRLFGFSAHKNMAENMLAAARLGWIDGLMVSYNYRLMIQDDMKKAVDACTAAGIGITAMKTQAAFSAGFYSSIGSETDQGLQMTDRFLKKGVTAEQAKLMAVWEDARIASICSAMSNMTELQANAAAAVSPMRLSFSDRRRLAAFAAKTASGYCRGCADICESAVGHRVPVGDLMRCAMYRNSYGWKETAAELFRTLPPEAAARIGETDFSAAEKACPQRIRIARVLKELWDDLA